MINRRVAKARANLLLDHPFMGTLAMNLELIMVPEDHPVTTACVDGKKIWFNEKFIEPLSDAELMFLVAHECMHPMLEHNYRAEGRDATLWNIACDVCVNQILTESKIGKFIEGGVLDANLYNAGGGVAERIYDLLKKEGSPDGAAYDNVIQSAGSAAERAQAMEDMRTVVAQATAAAKQAGKIPAGLEKLIGAWLKPRVDWRSVLRDFIVKTRSDERSYARFNRRYLSQHMYLPAPSGEMTGPLIFAVDCSGSVWDAFDQFGSEIHVVSEDMRPQSITVMYFDTQVSHVDVFEQDEDVEFKAHGGGGTAFSPVFEYIEREGLEPQAVIVLTDLECDDFGPVPEYPVLWVTTAPGAAPFGEIVEMQ